MEGSGLSRFKVNDTLFGKITPCLENGKVAFLKSPPDLRAEDGRPDAEGGPGASRTALSARRSARATAQRLHLETIEAKAKRPKELKRSLMHALLTGRMEILTLWPFSQGKSKAGWTRLSTRVSRLTSRRGKSRRKRGRHWRSASRRPAEDLSA
jgi:hypothetical protein